MTMSAKEKATATTATGEDTMEWSAEEEIQLFFALEGLKPVGVNKHFYMACITERLSKSLNRDVPAEAIWAHLRTLYNLDVLDEMEPLPFPNEQKDFTLPDTEFSALLSKKRAESEEKKVINVESAGSVTSLTTIQATPPSIIAVATDNTTKDKTTANKLPAVALPQTKELEKKIVTAKPVEAPKRTPKRTRGSMSLESNSPSTTPPPIQSSKRRRI